MRLGIFYSASLAEGYRAAFERDLKHAEEITQEGFAGRSFLERLQEKLCTVTAPLISDYEVLSKIKKAA